MSSLKTSPHCRKPPLQSRCPTATNSSQPHPHPPNPGSHFSPRTPPIHHPPPFILYIPTPRTTTLPPFLPLPPPPLQTNLIRATSLPGAQDQPDNMIDALAILDLCENGRPAFAHACGVALHDVQVRADGFCEVGLGGLGGGG